MIDLLKKKKHTLKLINPNIIPPEIMRIEAEV